MAFIKSPSYIKNSIMSFVRHLVDKSTKFALDTILSPCCQITAEVSLTCTGTDEATATFTITGLPSLINPIATVYDSNNVVIIDGAVVTDGSFTAPAVDTSTPGEIEWTIIILSATNSDGNKGIYLTTTVDVTIPTCV